MMSRNQRGGEEMSNKQSSVEWLMDKLFDPSYMQKEQLEWFEQAKEMHKEEIIDAYDYATMSRVYNDGEDYYNETFQK
jgi:hypothetical protein